jgi:hypothetical protein
MGSAEWFLEEPSESQMEIAATGVSYLAWCIYTQSRDPELKTHDEAGVDGNPSAKALEIAAPIYAALCQCGTVEKIASLHTEILNGTGVIIAEALKEIAASR